MRAFSFYWNRWASSSFSSMARMGGQKKQLNALKTLAIGERQYPAVFFICLSFMVGLSSNQVSNDKAKYEDKITSSFYAPSIQCDAKVVVENISKDKQKPNTTKYQKYKYVILGFGVAGQAALDAILSKEPRAQVLVVDSSLPKVQDLPGSTRIKFLWDTKVEFLDSESSIVNLSDGSKYCFEKCLVATGGAQPTIPSSFTSPDVKDKVSSFMPSTNINELYKIVANGGHVTVLGGTWSAFHLAYSLNKEAKSHGYKYGVTLVCSGNGVLSSALPKYLSISLNKRLNTRGLSTLPYTIVRYIDDVQQMVEMDLELEEEDEQLNEQDVEDENVVNNKEKIEDTKESDFQETNISSSKKVVLKPTKIEELARVYVCRTFDPLETGTFHTDHVVVASLDPQAMSCDSTINFSKGLQFDDLHKALKVNSELMASSRVYAAGESASVPLGHSFTSGVYRSLDHAFQTGLLAGTNMTGSSFLYDSIPLFVGEMENEIGVRTVMVGNCKSHLETHGFWWRVSRKGSIGPISSFYNDEFIPLYGLGVVLYLKNGKVCGVMLWGFPKYLSSQQPQEDLTWKAVQLAKDIIKGDSYKRFNEFGGQQKSRLERVHHLSTMAIKVVGMTDLKDHRPLHRYTAVSGKKSSETEYDQLFQHSRGKTSQQEQWDNHHRARSRGSWFEQIH